MISPDAPIQNASEDTLGRVSFAAMLTKAIAGVTGEDSFVLPAIIFIWTTWGREENARLYVGRIARSDREIVDLVNRFIYQTHSAGGGERVVRVRNKLSMKGLSSVLDLDDLRRRLQGIDPGTLDAEGRDVLKIALKQLTAMKEKGMTPEQFDASRFFED